MRHDYEGDYRYHQVEGRAWRRVMVKLCSHSTDLAMYELRVTDMHPCQGSTSRTRMWTDQLWNAALFRPRHVDLGKTLCLCVRYPTSSCRAVASPDRGMRRASFVWSVPWHNPMYAAVLVRQPTLSGLSYLRNMLSLQPVVSPLCTTSFDVINMCSCVPAIDPAILDANHL